jgi:ketosteroid isomerase-like protein
LDGVLADGYVESEQGKTTTKAQMIAAFKAGIYKVESEEFGDMRVVVFGDHAVVNGIAASKQTLRGKDSSGKFRFTDVFEKRDGRWCAVTTYLVKIE